MILSLQHITICTFSESLSQVMQPGVSCVMPKANINFLVHVTINRGSHSHATFTQNTRWCWKCSSPGRALSTIAKGVMVKMGRHNTVLSSCLKHTEIKTGCFCVITQNSSATAATAATYKPWNCDASHPCTLLISYHVSFNYFCKQHTSIK